MSKLLHIKNKIESGKTIKTTAFRKDIRKTEPHKHNSYFEIIYLSKGSGYHSIDSRKYTVKPPIIFFVRKEQIHYWELDTEPEGYVLIIKKSFIDKSLDNELKLLLTRVSSFSFLSINDNTTINQLFELLTKENKTENDSNFHLTEGLLKALLAKILEVAKPVFNKKKNKADLFQSFHELLCQDKPIKNKVAHYAARLKTTPQNLNTTCRKAVNQSAAEVLSRIYH